MSTEARTHFEGTTDVAGTASPDLGRSLVEHTGVVTRTEHTVQQGETSSDSMDAAVVSLSPLPEIAPQVTIPVGRGRMAAVGVVAVAALMSPTLAACGSGPAEAASRPSATSTAPEKPYIGPVASAPAEKSPIQYDPTGKVRIGSVDVETFEQRGFDPTDADLTAAGIQDALEDVARIGLQNNKIDVQIGLLDNNTNTLYVIPTEVDLGVRESVAQGTSGHTYAIVRDAATVGREGGGFTAIDTATGDADTVVGELPSDVNHQFAVKLDVNRYTVVTEACNNILDPQYRIIGEQELGLGTVELRGLNVIAQKVAYEGICNTIGLAAGSKAAGGDYGTYLKAAEITLKPDITHGAIVPYPILPEAAYKEL